MQERLSFGIGRKLPVIFQTELAECGLACLCMIAHYHGLEVSLASLRRRFALSLQGTTLASLMRIADRLNLSTRPLRLDIEDIGNLRLPCLLHWNFNHFVVLKSAFRGHVTIHDPAAGERRISIAEFSKSFTGVALEVWPNPTFRPEVHRESLGLTHLRGSITGLRRSLALVFALALAIEVFALISPLFMQWLLDNVLVSGDGALLITLTAGFALLLLFQQGTLLLRGWTLMYIGTMFSLHWRANVFRHLLHLPASYFAKRHLGDVVSRFGSIDSIQRTLTTSFIESVVDGLMSFVTIAVMTAYSIRLTLIVLSALAVYGILRWIWYRPFRTATEAQLVHAARQETHFLETARGIKTIKLFALYEERRSTWLSLLIDQINADLQTRKLTLVYQALNGLITGLERLAVLGLGASLVLAGHFTAGALVSFASYRELFVTRFTSLIDKFVELKMVQLQGERLADIVLTPTETIESLDDSGAAIPADASVEVINLRFRYSEHEPFILDGIAFRIEAGESVALVGGSGCGKTTLLNVLLGMLAQTEGDVLIGGVSTRACGLAAVRRMAGTVLQDDVLFNGSISDNIAFFDPQPNAEWIRRCAQLAAIHDDIERMPMRYSTLVGDMGTILSGGQKQRILLARALYKRPQLLFLDEATSHLDTPLERSVNAAIRELKITRIMIAHRPETIAMADRVLALSDGKISVMPPSLNRITGIHHLASI